MAKSADNVIGCPVCGYNLIASPARGRCPECGKRYRDLAPGNALAFWTNRRFALLLVLTPMCISVVNLLFCVWILCCSSQSSSASYAPTLFVFVMMAFTASLVWQIPLIVLSGAAGLLGRRHGETVLAYCLGAATHMAIGLWGLWEILLSADAQAGIGFVVIPIYSGIGGWLVAGLALCLCLLGRVVLRRRSRGGGEPEPDSRV